MSVLGTHVVLDPGGHSGCTGQVGRLGRCRAGSVGWDGGGRAQTGEVDLGLQMLVAAGVPGPVSWAPGGGYSMRTVPEAVAFGAAQSIDWSVVAGETCWI